MKKTVFISSTTKELNQLRNAVTKIAKQYGWNVERMEDKRTGVSYTVDQCRQLVRRCDLVVLIVAAKYGTIPGADDGGDGRTSFTHYEFLEAEDQGIPVRALLGNMATWPADKTDTNRENVDRFRGRINRFVSFFEHAQIKRKPDARITNEIQSLFSDHQAWLEKDVPGYFAQALQHHSVSDSWAFHLFEEPLLAKAHSLLDALRETRMPKQVWKNSYTFAIRTVDGTEDEPLPAKATSLELAAEIIARMAALPLETNRSHPLLTLLQKVAEYSTVLGPAVRTWCAIMAQKLNLKTEMPAPLPPAPAGEHRRTRVVVRFDKAVEEGAYLLRAWICDGKKPRGLGLEKETCTETNRAALLGVLAQELTRHEVRNAELEIAVPVELIGETVDRWEMTVIEDGKQVRWSLGARYPLVMRLLERASLVRTWGSLLADRFVTLAPIWKKPCRVDCMGNEKADNRPVALYSEEHGADSVLAHASSRHWIGCIIVDRPFGVHSQEQRGLVEALLKSGVPLVIWTRREEPERKLAVLNELKCLVEGHLLDEIGSHAHLHRTNHLGDCLTREHLSVIADRPDRPIPDIAINKAYYRSPTS